MLEIMGPLTARPWEHPRGGRGEYANAHANYAADPNSVFMTRAL